MIETDTNPMFNLFFVRHGQSEGNVNKSRYFEKLDCDIELTPQGLKDATNAAKKIKTLSHGRFNGSMFYSPYVRAKQTAQKIKDTLECPNKNNFLYNYSENALLHEREWGGLRDIVSLGMKSENHFNFYYRPINGESFSDCLIRVVTFDNWLMRVIKNDTIIVSHGEFLKLYMMYKLGWSVEEFNKWRTPKNGEVMMLYGFRNEPIWSLSPLTPVTERVPK